MEQGLQLKNNLDTDFKVIVKVAELIEDGVFDSDQVIIVPAGPKHSAYSKDIGGHSFFYSESKRKECIHIEVNQEGFYDMLPEGVFHEPPTGSSRLSEQEMINDVQQRREEEKDARKFFIPFEAELNYLKTLLELYENRLDKKTSYDDLTRIFASEWKEFESLGKEQSVIWMHFLPMIHQKRNDIEFLGRLLTLLFKVPVKIESYTGLRQVKIQETLQFKLGSGALGINSIIGRNFDNEQEEVHIHIGPAKTERLVDFMPGTADSDILDLVVSYILPIETDVKIKLITENEHRIGALGTDSSHSFLGYTVYL
jgi:hypothetical protein